MARLGEIKIGLSRELENAIDSIGVKLQKLEERIIKLEEDSSIEKIAEELANLQAINKTAQERGNNGSNR